MSKHFPLIFLFICLSSLSLSAEEPAELTDLRKRWEAQRGEAQAKIDERYFAELEELKKNYVKAGNLEAAIMVDNAIKGEKIDGEEPAALANMRQARDKSLGAKLKPMDKQYWQELKKLKQEFQTKGNLNGVLTTDAEIKKVLEAYKKPEPPKAKPKAEENPLEGTWIVTLSPGQASTTYKIKGGDIRVLKSHYLRVGDSAKMKKYKDGWIVNFAHPLSGNRPITEYFHLENDELTVRHWGVSHNHEAGPHSHTATVIKVEEDKDE